MTFSLMRGINDALDAMWKEDFYGDYFEHLARAKENHMSAKDVEFSKFQKDVNRVLVSMCGLGADDLPDAAWYDYFDCGLSAVEAIESAICDSWWDISGIEEQYDWYMKKVSANV